MMDVATVDAAAEQSRLIAALDNPAAFGGGCERVVHLETHISHVFLTGRYAYKIKKPVTLGFLDFGTLASRKRYCDDELRLNRRLAPALYLDVVPITGTLERPMIGGRGRALEYAVKMREFAQDALLSRVLARGELTPAHVDALAAIVADFHGRVDVARAGSAYGSPEDIGEYARQNFVQLAPLCDAAYRGALEELRVWTEAEFALRLPAFRRRKESGFVRECHGDLHLGNIALVDGEITVFDCIEFNEHLRWIDVMSEVAFLVMDLEDRGRPDFAHRLLDAWLAATGDYAGLAVLRFYLVYRALVRAKVAALRSSQLARGSERAALETEFGAYVRLAQRYSRYAQPAVVITHGFTGSGKTTATQALLELTGAMRVRTDVERKRLHGLAADARTGSALERGVYSTEATQRTYARALEVAGEIVDAGGVAIVDGAFLKRWERDLFRHLASARDVPFAIVSFAADPAALRARIEARRRHGRDASEADVAVLEHQLRTHDPLDVDERSAVIVYDAAKAPDAARRAETWRELLDRVAGASGSSDPPAGADPGLAAKVAFLSLPSSYPMPTTGVEAIETHMSWVFLTDRQAWKLKKPVRYDYLDFSTAELRRVHCAEEVRLNRRLTHGVYLDTVPLTVDDHGRLRLGPGGTVVDWLVQMQRLPRARMLDQAIRRGRVPLGDVRSAIRRLCALYAGCPPIPMSPAEYRARLAREIGANRRDLGARAFALPAEIFEPTCARLAEFVERQPALFDARVRSGRVVEGHGDLRPEHVCLLPEPQIIDCLEFSRDFRILDAADELAFLALECERLGAPGLRHVIFETYTRESGDAPPAVLVHFYTAHRACMRAKVALWHLNEPAHRASPVWPAQARDCLRLAREHVERCR